MTHPIKPKHPTSVLVYPYDKAYHHTTIAWGEESVQAREGFCSALAPEGFCANAPTFSVVAAKFDAAACGEHLTEAVTKALTPRSLRRTL